MTAFVLTAGGTGGHLFPAEALAAALIRRGAAVHLVTDRRADQFAAAVPGISTHQLRAGRPGGGVLNTVFGMAELTFGVMQARRLLRRIEPAAVVGFGGYPSLPTMVAATRLGFPTVIHEQNAVLGRANRMLARRVSRIATGFPETQGLRPADRGRAVQTGNPVRPAVLAKSGAAYVAPDPGGPIELAVFGGSQGAHVFAEVIPPALAMLPAAIRGNLRLTQQARPEDCDAVVANYQELGIQAEVQSFFTDVPERLAKAHLVICRAGASTIAELAAIGRPAILVPYPFAMDDHQAANARALAKVGGAWVVPQSALSPPMLAHRLSELLANPAGLRHAAAQARAFGRDDAADRLAALVLDTAPAAYAMREHAA